jgi:hypothetical protein
LVFLVFSFPLAFPPLTIYIPLLPHSCYMTRPSHLPRYVVVSILPSYFSSFWKNKITFMRSQRCLYVCIFVPPPLHQLISPCLVLASRHLSSSQLLNSYILPISLCVYVFHLLCYSTVR